MATANTRILLTDTSGNARYLSLSFVGDVLNITDENSAKTLSVDMAGGLVSKSGDTMTGELGIPALAFDTTPTGIPSDIGAMYWDELSKTIAIKTSADTTLQVGQEQIVYGLNYSASASTIHNGDAVIIKTSGATGWNAYPNFDLANASAKGTSYVIGIATQDIAYADLGFITIAGNVHDLRTDGVPQGETWSEGTVLYISTVDGQLTKNRPVAPLHGNAIAIVTDKRSTATGCVLVNPLIGFELGELHNVLTTTPTTGDILTYDSVAGYWKNAPTTVTTDSTLTGLGTAESPLHVDVLTDLQTAQTVTVSSTSLTWGQPIATHKVPIVLNGTTNA